MEHPFFALSTKKDIRSIEYKNDDVSIKLSPSAEFGLPTMMDKDILLYCGSLIMAEVNRIEKKIELEAEKFAKDEEKKLKADKQNTMSEIEIEEYLGRYKEDYSQEQRALNPIPKTIRFSCHDLMVTTNRHTNDVAYKQIGNAFQRLAGVPDNYEHQDQQKRTGRRLPYHRELPRIEEQP